MVARWTPRTLRLKRRWRIVVSAIISIIVAISAFIIASYKSVSLTVNGQTTQVHTLAMSVEGLLKEHGIPIKTHDFIQSTSGDLLHNGDTVVFHTAYEARITMDGHEIGFWTYVTSAQQLLELFRQRENVAEQSVKVAVNVSGIYDSLTGGLVINSDGPVTVLADGKTHIAPDGKLPAAAIIDAQGIHVAADDRVSVYQDNGQTVLRITRITYAASEQDTDIPYTSRVIYDPNLDEGTRIVTQQGAAGLKKQQLRQTLADGQLESSAVTHETVVRDAVEEILTIGTKKPAQPSATPATAMQTPAESSQPAQDHPKESAQSSQPSKPATQTSSTPANPTQPTKPAEPDKPSTPAQTQPEPSQPAQPAQPEHPQPQPPAQPQPQQTGLWHPTVAQAKAYARAAAAQYGWTGDNWTALEWLWNRESGWRWNAENRWSGAYGIPQSLPGNKMASFGANWRDDASIQINWGLSYIRRRYTNPLGAQDHSKKTGWY